jgi:hypothetical protein
MTLLLEAGDLLYIPSKVYVYQKIKGKIDSPLAFSDTWALEKPTHALLLERERRDDIWLKILHDGSELYVDKHDILPYQEK